MDYLDNSLPGSIAAQMQVPPKKRGFRSAFTFSGEEIVACDRIGITVALPKPMTSGAKSEGSFGKQDFVYLPEEDVYRWRPARG